MDLRMLIRDWNKTNDDDAYKPMPPNPKAVTSGPSRPNWRVGNGVILRAFRYDFAGL
jgi:hypothetical protein